MGFLTWLSGIAGGGDAARPESARPADARLSPRLEQERRIHLKAQRYRQAVTERRKAQQAREEQAERERQARAVAEFEDDLARALAEGGALFPSAGRGGTLPGLLSLEQWRSHGNEDIGERR